MVIIIGVSLLNFLLTVGRQYCGSNKEVSGYVDLSAIVAFSWPVPNIVYDKITKLGA